MEYVIVFALAVALGYDLWRFLTGGSDDSFSGGSDSFSAGGSND